MRLFKPGLTKPKLVDPKLSQGAIVRPHPLKGSLRDYAKENVLFSVAPLAITQALKNLNVIQEWVNAAQPPKTAVGIIQLPAPIFDFEVKSAVADVLSRVLWYVHRDYAKNLCYHISTTGMLDRERKVLTKVLTQELMIPNMGSIGQDPVPVVVFSVDGSDVCTQVTVDPNTGMCKIVRQAPNANTVELATTLLSTTNENNNAHAAPV